MFNKGFTKIEIFMVVLIAVIIIIINVFVVNYYNKKSYDLVVLSEVDQIRSGLEQFHLINNYYPKVEEPVELNNAYSGTEKLCQNGWQQNSASCEKNILNPVPNIYLNDGNVYVYKTIDNYNDYQIEFTLKTNFKKQGLLKGKNCATNIQTVSRPCF